MYQFSKLSRSSLAIVATITSGAGNQSEAFQIAVAYAIGTQLPIPPAGVDCIDTYFRNNNSPAADETLDKINSILPFDYKATKRLVESFYRFRYNAAFMPIIPLSFREGTGIIDLFTISRYFSNDTLAVINKDPQRISMYVNAVQQLIADIAPKPQEAGVNAWDREQVHGVLAE